MFSALLIPAAVFLIASLLIPESPRWMLARGDEAGAREVLRRIGGAAYANAEVLSIEGTLRAESAGRLRWRELWGPGLRRIVLVGVALAVLQQWTGINTLFNYAAEVYRGAGYGANDILLNIVITGAINLVFTALAMVLVDRVGRRWLMIFGCLGIGCSHLLCALAYRARWQGSAVLVLTLCAIACYALTLAPVTWVLIAEIFPNRARSVGVSAAVSALWMAAFVLTYTFPLLNRSFGTAGIFVGYGLICLLGCAVVVVFVPETRGQSLETIEREMEFTESSRTQRG
jgi:sugar porter (SP) family MFS transporter